MSSINPIYLVSYDYGYENLSATEKVQDLISRMNKFKIFVDVYPNPTNRNFFYTLALNLAESKLHPSSSKLSLKFKPLQESFLYYGLRKWHSQLKLRLVGSHFATTQKVIKVIPDLILEKGSNHHLTSYDSAVRLKITTASRRQLENLDKMGMFFISNDASSEIQHNVFETHAMARHSLNDSRSRDEILRRSIINANDSQKIGQIQELTWDIDVHELYYFSKHDVDPIVEDSDSETDEGLDF